MFSIKVNGQIHEVKAESGTPLLWVIRDHLDMIGTKFGCGVAACGACTVHMNGEAVRSCQTPIEDAGGASITTIEGLKGKAAAAVQAAWRKLDVVQCGYCQSGQIMQATALLKANPKPTDDEIIEAMNGNACRCATYQRIHAAIRLASDRLEG